MTERKAKATAEAKAELVAGRDELRAWALGGSALEDDDVVAVEGD